MEINFIAKYYSLVTDDTIEIKFTAKTIKDAYDHAQEVQRKFNGAVEMDFDLYVDALMITSANVDTGTGKQFTI